MFSMPADLASVAQALAALLIALAAIAALWIEVRRIRRDARLENHVIKQQLEELALEVRKEQRGEQRLATEQRRVAEVNVSVDNSLLLTEPATDPKEAERETPFSVFSLSLTNDGDGPVDILASLGASRIMSSKYRFGIGLHTRDVEWEDHQPYFWNQGVEKDEQGNERRPLFTGNSTTRTMVSADDDFMRLAPHEHGTLQRIDAVNDTVQLVNRAPIYMLYRVFLVARGYPLGEILRQLGAVPPVLLDSVRDELLNFQAVAQPVYATWRAVQEALLNLSRMAFKVASEEDDALGHLANPDAFRFFLLRHKDFIGEVIGSDGRATTMDEVAGEFWAQYASQYHLPTRNQLPRDFGANKADPIYQQAHQHCSARLDSFLKNWESLKQVIRECDAYPVNRNVGYPSGLIKNELPRPTGCPDEGYPVRVHTDPVYQRLWLDLLNDGYLITKPFPPHHEAQAGSSASSTGYFAGSDIPPDPRILEPFVMRVHYFRVTLNVDASLKSLYLAASH
jgi:hypothetical protein